MVMNCRRVVNLSSAYVDGELTGAEMLAIRRHLSDCAECAEEYASVRLTKQAVARLATAVPRKDFAASILKKLDEVEISPYERFAASALRFMHHKLSPVAAALAASGVALVMLTAGGIDRGLPEAGQQMAAASYESRLQDVAFLRELHGRPAVPGSEKPLVVASETPEVGPELHFASFTR